METSVPYLLHSISVVVTAEQHDPLILSPLFLEKNRIVPGDWGVVKSETTHTTSYVRYDHILLKMDALRFEIQEAVEGPFRESYDAHSIADAYISKVSYTPYRSLGLNCAAYIKTDSPEQWMSQRFLCPGAWLDGDSLYTVQARIAVQTDDDILCLISFNTGEMKNEQTGESERIVIVSVNIDHPGPINTDFIREAIRKWPKRQELIFSTLDKFLMSP